MNWIKQYLKVFSAAVLVALFPIVFLYNHNASKLNLQSLFLPLVISLALTLLVTAVSVLTYKSSLGKAILASVLFIIFFYFYGTTYDLLLKIDLIQVEHLTWLPIYIFLVYLFIRFVQRFNKSDGKYLMRGILLLFGGLVLFNVIATIPVEIRKHTSTQAETPNTTAPVTQIDNIKRPDVYYIVVDESVGFDALRDYWHYPAIDNFKNFLKSKGFFVAEGSRSKSFETLIELSSRLNMEDWSKKSITVQDWFAAIANNKVMQDFKQLGYTTVVLDQVKAANGYVTKTPITADYSFSTQQSFSRLWSFDDFFTLVYNRSLLRPYCDRLRQSDPAIIQHRNAVLFFFDKIAHLENIPSPKFVYGQVLLTHVPLIFDENGGLLDSKNYYNWDFYIESYKFEIVKVTELINSILSQADPNNPPIIVFQSDHGFRNIDSGHAGSKILPNYPEEYKYHIINAMLLPGYDISQLPDNLDPINTFVIILDHYFNQKIPMQ